KENAGRASQGTLDIDGLGRIGGVLFWNFTRLHYQFLPHRGSAPAMQDLGARQIDKIFYSPIDILPQGRAGPLTALAVAARSRLAAAPNMPAMDEAGLPGFYVSNWRALWASKGTLKDIIVKLNAAVIDALGYPGVRQRFTNLGQQIF